MSDPDSRERPFTALASRESDEAQPAREQRARGWELSEAIGIFVLLLVAAACGGLIAVYWPWNQGESAATAERLSAMEMRVGQLAAAHGSPATSEASAETRKLLATLQTRLDGDEARLSAMEKSGGPGPNVPLDQIAARLAALEATAPPADLAQRLQSFSLKTDEAALDARLVRLESRDPDAVMKRAASILALSDLRSAQMAGVSYERELTAMHALLPDAPEFRQMAPRAQSGVPTRAMLATQLTDSADRIIAADRESQAKNWLEKLWLHVEGLVSIRAVGNVKGTSTQAHIARAEVAMRGGDLKRAIAELNGLVAPARAAAKSWIDAANARLDLESAMRGLSNRVVAVLSIPLPGDTVAAPAPTPTAVVPVK